ncbi:MAG: hypothetical protein NTY64_11080 [Deltaproteobacteria bacterium]|nr:hypothetical protein [Deltaproteobacteria bacterium]
MRRTYKVRRNDEGEAQRRRWTFTYKVRRNDEGEAQRRRWTFYEAIIICRSLKAEGFESY